MAEHLDSPVTRQLHALGVNYETIEILLDPDKKPVQSLEELLAGQNRSPSQIVRSLVFRTGSGGFILLAVAGRGKADWGMLRKHLNERRLTMAQPTGGSVGSDRFHHRRSAAYCPTPDSSYPGGCRRF
jgi:Cys-tRNA(Pro)/Cys-tRNA(Cys) deacylase